MAVGAGMVVIELTVRRFKCVNATCEVVTFAEQVPDLTTPHSRYTPLLRGTLTEIGLALAGRAGVRLAAALGIRVGRDTLLRLVRQIPETPLGSVRVLGVDDFALRRGHRYGTVLVNLDTRRPIDLFDGRDGAALAAWLREHPGIEVICRDRSGGYGEGARLGAPQAIQVADRFHLWQNLGQAVEKTVNAHRERLAPALPTVDSAPLLVQPPVEKKIVTRFRRQHAAVHELSATGLSHAAVGRVLGLHPATVRKLAQAASVDDLIAKTEQRASIVDGYTEHLHRRWNEGEHNATRLYREIKELGYPGGELAVQRYLRRFRTGRGFAAHTGPKPPSVREATGWIMTHPDRLHAENAAALTGILDRDKDLRRLTAHVRAFAAMMNALHGHRLETWIEQAERGSFPALASFARHLRRDLDAVRHGLTLPHSSGAVEGNINRLKMLKRQMYGRANLDLLRKRVLLAR